MTGRYRSLGDYFHCVELDPYFYSRLGAVWFYTERRGGWTGEGNLRFAVLWGNISAITNRHRIGYDDPGDRYPDAVLKPDTLLHKAFRGVCGGDPPFGFFDMLLEEHPDLEPYIRPWVEKIR